MAGDAGSALGDRVRIRVDNWQGVIEHEGVLLPAAGEGHVTLKLDNGYNISFSESSITSLQTVGEPHHSTIGESAVEQDTDLPAVTIIHTGGTIASKVDYKTGAVVARFEPDELLAENPDLRSQAQISTVKLGNMWSDDMRTQHWNSMISATQEAFEQGAVGVVVCQGTDTMHISSAALAFAWCGSGATPPGRIAFTGSQRSSDRGSSDAGENLLAAVHWAAHGPEPSGAAGDGTVVVMHAGSDDGRCAVWPGIAVRKLHTSRRDAFQGVNRSPLAYVNIDQGAADIELCYEAASNRRQSTVSPTRFDAGVKLTHLLANPHLDSSLVDYCTQSGHAGLILHGTGLGHLPVENGMDDAPENLALADSLRAYSDAGGVAVVVAQCIHGGIDMNVYSKGRNQQKMGILGHGSNTAADTMAVKLHWLLSQPEAEDSDWVRARISTDLCGENPATIRQ